MHADQIRSKQIQIGGSKDQISMDHRGKTQSLVDIIGTTIIEYQINKRERKRRCESNRSRSLESKPETDPGMGIYDGVRSRKGARGTLCFEIALLVKKKVTLIISLTALVA